MMAVRDRGKDGKWKCSNGICVQDPTGIYLSKSECEAKLILSELPVGTGQCDTLYYIYGSTGIYYRTRGSSNAWQYQSGSQVVNTFIRGPINIWVVNNAGAIGTTTEAFLKGRNPSTLAPTVQQIGNLTQFNNNLEYKLQMNFYSGKPDRTDGLPDNCGNAANVCPP